MVQTRPGTADFNIVAGWEEGNPDWSAPFSVAAIKSWIEYLGAAVDEEPNMLKGKGLGIKGRALQFPSLDKARLTRGIEQSPCPRATSG